MKCFIDTECHTGVVAYRVLLLLQKVNIPDIDFVTEVQQAVKIPWKVNALCVWFLVSK